jgi:hypothetical protein
MITGLLLEDVYEEVVEFMSVTYVAPAGNVHVPATPRPIVISLFEHTLFVPCDTVTVTGFGTLPPEVDEFMVTKPAGESVGAIPPFCWQMAYRKPLAPLPPFPPCM